MNRHQSPGMQIILVLAWLHLFALLWYSIDHPERGGLTMHVVGAFIYAIVLLSINYRRD